MGKTRVLKSVVAATLLCSCNAYANDLGTISVESSTINDTFEHKKDEVSNVSIITNEDVEKINPTSISEVLDKVPGITYSLTGTDSLKVHIRGIDNQMYMGEKPGVAIVIDGVPVQETTGKINVDLDNIESIKVIKGGASYLYGNDAIGGAVVITTKRPKAGTSAKVEAELGTFNSKRFLASINKGFENSALQLQGSYRDSDGYWEDAYVTVKSVNGKYQYYLTDYSDLTVGLDYTKRKTGDGNSVSGTIEAENNPKSEGYYSYGGYYDSDLTKAYVTYKQDIDQSSDFLVRLHHYKDDKTSKSRRTEYDNEEVWKQNGAKAEYKKSFESFAVMAGVDVQRNETDEASYIAATGALRAKYDTKEDINAIYTELKYAITNSLTSTLNLRYDDIKLKYVDKMDSTLDVSPSYDATSYRLGLNYKFSQNHLLYTSVSTGFRTPTVGQISSNQEAKLDDPTLDVPSDIDVEKTYNYELGFRGSEGILTYDAAVYQLDRKKYIGKVAGSYISSDEDEENIYNNVGDMRSRGFELALNTKVNEMFNFDISYTYLRAKFKDYTISRQMTADPDGWGPLKATYERTDLSGNYVPRTSKHNLNLTLNFKPIPNWTISPELVVKSSYYADEVNENKQEGFEIVNLRTTYAATKNFEVFGKVNNLFDKDYYQFVNLNSSALATMENDATIRVAPGRTFYAGVRYKF